MNPTVVAVALATAILLVVTLTAIGWADWYRHPERYGHTPRDRPKRRRWLTRPTRGRTRQPITHWTARWIRR